MDKYSDNTVMANICTCTKNSKTPEEILKEAIDALEEIKEPQILYYAISNFVKKGEIIHLYATDINPEYIVFNKEDFEENIKLISSLRNLVLIDEFDYFNYYLNRR